VALSLLFRTPARRLALLALDHARIREIREIVGGGSKPRPWLQFSEAAPSCAEKLERAEDERRWDSGNEVEPVAPRRWAPASPFQGS
jgi:hypothetical protein